ncbi:MAG: nucleotidyltransferase family protein [Rhodobacterales bacterium]|nr:nucleotidyltransferase family protein [Rhodobacterales bacterium]
MRPAVHILVLAAGASSRMRGRDKLLQPIKGKPILRLMAEQALSTGSKVYVTLPPAAEPRQRLVADLPITVVPVPDAALGMSRSIQRGILAIEAAEDGPEDGMMVLPADMPEFSSKALADLISRFRTEPELIWRGGTTDGTPGHPTIFPRDLWAELRAVTGDEGGRSVLKRHSDRVRVVPLPGRMAVLDLDTPEDWAAYLGRPGPSG